MSGLLLEDDSQPSLDVYLPSGTFLTNGVFLLWMVFDAKIKLTHDMARASVHHLSRPSLSALRSSANEMPCFLL